MGSNFTKVTVLFPCKDSQLKVPLLARLLSSYTICFFHLNDAKYGITVKEAAKLQADKII